MAVKGLHVLDQIEATVAIYIHFLLRFYCFLKNTFKVNLDCILRLENNRHSPHFNVPSGNMLTVNKGILGLNTETNIIADI